MKPSVDMRILWLWLLLGGCVEQVEGVAPPDPQQPVEASLYYYPDNVYEEDPQCRDLLGPVADTLTDRNAGDGYASFPLSQPNNGGLWRIGADGRIAPPAGNTVDGKTLDGLASLTKPVKVKFVGEAQYDPDFGWTYLVQYPTSTASGGWTDYCPMGERATALKGRWNSTAFRTAQEEITFGCVGSAMAKCYLFGYWPDDGDPATLDYDPMSVRWRAHQACTRMARADVCGNGEPHTRPGTRIVIRDNIKTAFNPPPYPRGDDPYLNNEAPFQKAPTNELAPPDYFFYESAWTWRENAGAICLERERWKSLAEGSCPNLPDPRLDPTARFCSEIGIPLYETSANVTLFNMSLTSDLTIAQWTTPTGETVATARGFWRARTGGGFVADPPPFPGEGYNKQIATNGFLLRNPPVDSNTGNLTPVFSTKIGSDRVLGVSTLKYTDPTFEGYVINTSGQGRVKYGIYEKKLSDGTRDTVTGYALDPLVWSRFGWLGYIFAEPLQTP